MRRLGPLAAAVLLATACGSETTVTPTERSLGVSDARPAADASTTTMTTTTSTTRGLPSGVIPPPGWLGTRVLTLRSDGLGEIQPTPPELRDRRLVTTDVLVPPGSAAFEVRVSPVPDDVIERSTWSSTCPVGRDDLRYVLLPFHGFDGRLHTGELLVHRDAVDVVVAGFGHLFDSGFPIEEMRVVRRDELDAPPTGDGNNTSAFVCRQSVGSATWSQHAFGLAVDINPFHNPYAKGELVIPELASAYRDRAQRRPGMLDAASVRAFTDAGWGWGGAWRSAKDWMHLSATGR